MDNTHPANFSSEPDGSIGYDDHVTGKRMRFTFVSFPLGRNRGKDTVVFVGGSEISFTDYQQLIRTLSKCTAERLFFLIMSDTSETPLLSPVWRALYVDGEPTKAQADAYELYDIWKKEQEGDYVYPSEDNAIVQEAGKFLMGTSDVHDVLDTASVSGMDLRQIAYLSAISSSYRTATGEPLPLLTETMTLADSSNSYSATSLSHSFMSAVTSDSEAARHGRLVGEAVGTTLVGMIGAVGAAGGSGPAAALVTGGGEVLVAAGAAIAAIPVGTILIGIGVITLLAAAAVATYVLLKRTAGFRKKNEEMAKKMGLTDWDAHHSIGFARWWGPVHDLIRKYGLDINDPLFNGVPMPRTKQSPNPYGQKAHQGLHTLEYTLKRVDALRKMKTREDFVRKAREFQQEDYGSFPAP